MDKVKLKVAGDKMVTVTPGVINAKAKRAYCYGQCFVLAMALHEIGNWPVILCKGKTPEDRLGENYDRYLKVLPILAELLQEDKGGSYQTHYDQLEEAAYVECSEAPHYCVQLPDGRYLDITGAHSPEQFIELPHLFDADLEDFHKVPKKELDPLFLADHLDLETARAMAAAVVKEYNVKLL